jgi:hypothetical protein
VVDGDQRREPVARDEGVPDAGPDHPRRNHDGVNGAWRVDVPIRDVVAGGKHEHRPVTQVRPYVLLEHCRSDFVGEQEDDDVGACCRLGKGHGFEAVASRLILDGPRAVADDDRATAVAQVHRLRPTLIPVPEDRDRLACQVRQIGVIVAEHLCHVEISVPAISGGEDITLSGTLRDPDLSVGRPPL